MAPLPKAVSVDSLRQATQEVSQKTQKYFSVLIPALFLAVQRLGKSTRRLIKKPQSKQLLRFVKRYSAQLSFAVLVAIFLTVTVGEGQAYDVNAPKLAAQLESAQSNGFIGKPQVFTGQTVLTGEVQQNVAIIYTVEKGDTVSSVADRYSLSVGTILDKNNIAATDANKITPGSELIIPAEDTNSSLAWLDSINKAKEEEQKQAEAARQKQLALQQKAKAAATAKTSVSYTSGDYTVVGRMWGQYNGGYPGQCTWYVNYRRSDLPNGMGNGGQYLANARAKGLPTGSVARVGAVGVTSESYYGHVFIVDAVSGSSMTVSEMNYVGTGIISRRTLPVNYYAIKGFIY